MYVTCPNHNPHPSWSQTITSFYPMISIEEAEQSRKGMRGNGEEKGKDRPLLRGLRLAVPWLCLRLSTHCMESQGGNSFFKRSGSQPLSSPALLLPLLDLDLLLCQLFLATLPPASPWLRSIHHHPCVSHTQAVWGSECCDEISPYLKKVASAFINSVKLGSGSSLCSMRT